MLAPYTCKNNTISATTTAIMMTYPGLSTQSLMCASWYCVSPPMPDGILILSSPIKNIPLLIWVIVPALYTLSSKVSVLQKDLYSTVYTLSVWLNS